MMKICSKCGIEKNVEDYSKNKSNRDGHAHFCKDCYKVYYHKRKKNLATERSFDRPFHVFLNAFRGIALKSK